MSAVADKVRYVRDAGWGERALEDPRNAYWGDPLHPERELDLDDAYETQRDREAFAAARPAPPVKYVVGLAFTPNLARVALIEKRRPAWQAGFLNGVGGGVEHGESPADAMAREGDEEAGLAGLEWVEFLTYDDARGYRVAFYRATLGARQDPVSRTDEQVSLERVDDVCAGRLKVVHNIPWLVTMAVAHAAGGPAYAIVDRGRP